MSDDLRAHLARALEWHEAHATFDQAVADVPLASRGAVAPGFAHTLWQMLEHIRIAQFDLLDFCANPSYAHTMRWPDDYWPPTPVPPDAAAWDASIAGCLRDRDALEALVLSDRFDLMAPVPTGKPAQTGLRAILLTIDHNAYHVGQMVALRKALGIWNPS
ncbi:MAG: DinB family protein [Vicinamibacterales bacterium]